MPIFADADAYRLRYRREATPLLPRYAMRAARRHAPEDGAASVARSYARSAA